MENNEKQIVKDIKHMWIYVCVFFVVVIGLILISSYIQQKVISYQNEAKSASESYNENKTLLKNVQEENAALKKEQKAIKSEYEIQKENTQNTSELLTSCVDMIGNGEKLINAYESALNNNYKKAKEILKTVDKDKLSEEMQTKYESLKKSLGE